MRNIATNVVSTINYLTFTRCFSLPHTQIQAEISRRGQRQRRRHADIGDPRVGRLLRQSEEARDGEDANDHRLDDGQERFGLAGLGLLQELAAPAVGEQHIRQHHNDDNDDQKRIGCIRCGTGHCQQQRQAKARVSNTRDRSAQSEHPAQFVDFVDDGHREAGDANDVRRYVRDQQQKRITDDDEHI